MAELATREGARGEMFIVCPRGHHVHIAWTDRPMSDGIEIDGSERAAINRFAFADGRDGPAGTTLAKCPECKVPLQGMIVQGKAL